MPVTYRSLLAPGAAPEIDLDAVLEGLSWDTEQRRGRPHVLLNMIATADGRATIAGRSGPIGSRGDRELFAGLRSLIDGVLIGASTLRVERYNRIADNDEARARRRARGLAEQPLACVVSRSLQLDPSIPLLADAGAKVVVATPSTGVVEGAAAPIQYIRTAPDQPLDLAACLAELHDRFDVGTLLCEGGPHLAGQLLAADLVDELFLTVAPKLASGAIATTPSDHAREAVALPVLSGPALDPPAELELVGALEADSYLFLRYRVRR
jgi:riboflavin biosynthesis pyrimidine reductase